MGYNVLIVDDSAITRTIVEKTLAMAKLEVNVIHKAANGHEALRVLADEWIDIVFTDLNMPEMSGEELVEEMAKDSLFAKIPVVVVSSDRSACRMERLTRNGVKEYIKKPFRPEMFRDAMARTLGGKASS